MASIDYGTDVNRTRPMTREEKKVILASSAGTIFEWYDFYLYGSLAAIIGAQFFTPFPEATRNVFALLAFAAGFIVRPLGALVFGSLGDLVGRKYTFLMTVSIMGLTTFLVGCLPSYYSWGVAAPIILIGLRLLQGLALGGEYGGAAVYVAEHAPIGRRGYYTSFIQTTATLGLLLSLVVILLVTAYVNGNYEPVQALNADGTAQVAADGTPVMLEPFKAWGWRVPFLLSSILLAISLYIRLTMNESPAFKKMKEEGAASKAPLREAFGTWKNGKFALIALFGLTMGQAVVWYSGQFYALFFMQNVVKLDSFTANVFVAWSLILGTGFFLFFGALSDRIGRKPIILAGCLLAAITYFPVFEALTRVANPALHAAQQTPVEVTAAADDCSFQFNPVGTAKFTTSCDIAMSQLAKASVNYTTIDAESGSPASITIGDTVIPSYDAGALSGDELAAAKTAFETQVNDALKAAGYPLVAADNTTIAKTSNFFDIFTGQKLAIVAILTYLIILVTMVYGPIAAMLCELFPTRIRYSGMSLPYHIGNGWFGGLLPATVFAISAQQGNIYAGLWYPIIIAAATVVIGAIFVPGGTQSRSMFTDDPEHKFHH
ncbi:Permease of the major facilitator superfamily [Rubellimicrobium mesophilum DSM 19309]|uniref:Permease of the major facilitator superfamily n=1 Tax=Rubellimicrobium mesophilum DSM 19309 TaxID=442562 RepID=A0A017HIZ2_9RHOB|nr:MFS transporter [Rubellimicrobium mesophilum]EYD74093.1 Permease of the major facilitator superfamily [Rubellimicrobium mesophilum DSM 19309]